MKIVCAVHRYFPASSGSEVYAKGLCEFMVRRGHAVTVVCTDRLAAKRRHRPLCEVREGVRIVRVSTRSPAGWLAKGLRHPLRRVSRADPFGLMQPVTHLLRDGILREDPDLILALPASRPCVVAAAMCRRKLGVPGVVVPFYHISDRGFVDHEARWMEVLRAFDCVLAMTLAEEEFLVQRGVPAERIARPGMFVNPLPPVAPDEPRAWRRSHGIGERFLVVGAAAHFSRAKGIWSLAEASCELPDVRFVLLGGDERTRERLRKAVLLGPNVELAGFVGEHEKAVVLHAADLFAMPSSADSFGIVYIEANACGTPALAADTPVMREVLGPEGRFVPFEDVGALARALRERAEAPRPGDDLAKRVERNAERFAPGRALERTAVTLEDVARRGGPFGGPQGCPAREWRTS